MTKKTATIIAVAERARVSPSTVSRVMNGRFTVDPVIADRVREAVKELQYSPNQRARSLVLGRTNTVAILVPDLGNPTFQSILRGLTRAAARDGFRVLVADSAETAGDEATLAAELRSRTDALVLCAPRMPEPELALALDSLAPVVMINRDLSGVLAPILTVDYRAGIQLLAEHLYGLGHRRIVYLQGNVNSASNAYRLDGLAQFTAAHPDVDLIALDAGVTFEHGYAAADSVLGSGATGCLCFNDLVAMGLLSALNERGVPVPGRLSLTGFDDITFARYTTPPLTTASVAVEQLGEDSWSRVYALISGETPDENVTVQPQLEIRGSTGPVPTAR